MDNEIRDNSPVCDLVRQMQTDYTSGTTKISKYVENDQYETINRIDAYLNSKHITGSTDSQGREKPFFNIVTAAVNVWFRATDIDRKDIKIKATRSYQDIAAFLATCHVQKWMTKAKFGKYLNSWGRTLSKYGSAVTKFIESNGKLNIRVIPWNRIICDVIDFDANPVIEMLELTPSQLRKKKEYDQVLVEKLIEADRAARTDLEGQQRDAKSGYIKVYEIHGELDKSFKTGKETDKGKFKQQMQVVSFVAGKDDGKFDDFVLYKGWEAKTPYQKDDLIEEDDQTLSIGAVQNLFDAQWRTNHRLKSVEDQLDLASKLIFQTADSRFQGQNVLTAIEQGDVLVHAVNQPLTQVANTSHDVVSQTSVLQLWRNLGKEINGISDAMLGANQPAGSAWRQTEALLQESHSLFEVMTENKGLALEDMFREYILPYIKKQMDTSEEIAATLDSYGITKIDSRFIPNEAIRRGNKQMIDQALAGQEAQQADYGAHQKQIQSELQQQGNQRFFKPSDIPDKTWKELFKDLEWELEVDITGEQTDTQAVMQTLNTALKMFVTATPQQLADPNFKLVFNKILEQSAVISPIEIASIPPTPPPTPMNKVSESMSYKDVPDDVKRQIEQQAGLKPSTEGAPQQDQTQVNNQTKVPQLTK